MTTPKIQLGRDPAFERFLAAAVGEDARGDTVSVLSMLARLNLDPWDEATDLANMAHAPAQKRLEGLLAQCTEVPILASARGAIAVTLLEVLPRRAKRSKPSADPVSPKAVSAPRPKIAVYFYWIGAAVVILAWIANLAQTH